MVRERAPVATSTPLRRSVRACTARVEERREIEKIIQQHNAANRKRKVAAAKTVIAIETEDEIMKKNMSVTERILGQTLAQQERIVATEEQCDIPFADDDLTVAYVAKKCRMTQYAVRSAMEMAERETLPSVHDPDAIAAFFQKSKKKTFTEILTDNLRSPPMLDGSFANQLAHLDNGEKEMSVKEALAQNFRNYKVRIPKAKKLQEYIATTSNSRGLDSSFFSALFANSPAFSNVDMSMPDPYAQHQQSSDNGMHQSASLKDMLTAMMGDDSFHQNQNGMKQEAYETLNLQQTLGFDQNGMRPFSASPMVPQSTPRFNSKKSITDLLIDISCGKTSNNSSMIDESTLIPIHEYPYPPFYKIPLEITKGYKGGYFIKGVKYVQMNTLIHLNCIIVPVSHRMKFKCDGNLLEMTLSELFAANGIDIRNPSGMEELQRFFSSCIFLLHHAIAEFLLNTYGPLSTLNPHAKTHRVDQSPIPLSFDTPPFACIKMQYFALALGNEFGDNAVFDVSRYASAPVDTTLDSLSPPPSTSIISDINCLPLRDRASIICSFDTGARVDQLAHKFHTTTDVIRDVVLHRADVLREQTEHYMEEALSKEVQTELDQLGQGYTYDETMKVKDHLALTNKIKKSKIRRTSFAGLNVQMWKFFKNCQEGGITLNGKMLKEQAMQIAKEMGLDNFKGSEGWLDAFKRRHKIDLKVMSGIYVKYEEDEENENTGEQMDESAHTGDSSMSQCMQSTSDGHGMLGTTAALLAGLEKATAPSASAVASISNTQPIDLNFLFGGASTSADNGLLECFSPGSLRSVTGRDVIDERGCINAIVKSAAIKSEPEIANAMDIIRSFILINDVTFMPKFLAMQLELAGITPPGAPSILDEIEPNHSVDETEQQQEMEEDDVDSIFK